MCHPTLQNAFINFFLVVQHVPLIYITDLLKAIGYVVDTFLGYVAVTFVKINLDLIFAYSVSRKYSSFI